MAAEPQNPVSTDPAFGLPKQAQVERPVTQAAIPPDEPAATLVQKYLGASREGHAYAPDGSVLDPRRSGKYDRPDNQVAGIPPELVPITALRAVPGAMRSIAGGVGLGGKALAGAGLAGPIIASDLARRGLSAAGVPSWAASGIGNTLGVMLGGKMGAARTAAEEAPLSAEGQAAAQWGKSTSGVPNAEPVVPSPRSGALTASAVSAPPVPSTSGVPVALRMAPVSGSGSIAGSELPSGWFGRSSTGAPTEAPTAAPSNGMTAPESSPFQGAMRQKFASIQPEAGRITLKDLTPDERSAFDALIKQGYEGGSVLKQILAKRGGSQ